MPPKRSAPVADPPSSSSEDDETEDEHEQPPQIPNHKTTQQSSSEEEEESEDDEEFEEEETNPAKISVENPKTQNPNSKSAHSSSESESESESEEKGTKPKSQNPNLPSRFESEPEFSSPTASAFTIRPSQNPNSKRPAVDTKHDHTKKPKVVSNGDVSDDKKSTVKRVWTDDDEIALLQGFIDYQSEKRCYPLQDIDGFHGFIMGSLSGNLSKSQLYDKVKRLKRKYQVNMEKGGDPVFSKPHEHTLFELSKKIWGCPNGNGGKASKVVAKERVKEKVKGDQVMWDKGEDFERLYPHWSGGLRCQDSWPSFWFQKGGIEFVKENLNLIGRDEMMKMEEMWKEYYQEEVVLRAKRHKLMGEMSDLVAKNLGK